MPEALLVEVDAWAAAETNLRFGHRVSRSQAIRELCARALRSASDQDEGHASSQPPPERGIVSIRSYRLGEEPVVDADTRRMSPAERVAMMGDLALAAYELRGENVAPRIRRDAVRVVRGRR